MNETYFLNGIYDVASTKGISKEAMDTMLKELDSAMQDISRGIDIFEKTAGVGLREGMLDGLLTKEAGWEDIMKTLQPYWESFKPHMGGTLGGMGIGSLLGLLMGGGKGALFGGLAGGGAGYGASRFWPQIMGFINKLLGKGEAPAAVQAKEAPLTLGSMDTPSELGLGTSVPTERKGPAGETISTNHVDPAEFKGLSLLTPRMFEGATGNSYKGTGQFTSAVPTPTDTMNNMGKSLADTVINPTPTVKGPEQPSPFHSLLNPNEPRLSPQGKVLQSTRPNQFFNKKYPGAQ